VSATAPQISRRRSRTSGSDTAWMIELIRRIVDDFMSTHAARDIVRAIQEANADLSCVPNEARPEMLERLVRQRLAST